MRALAAWDRDTRQLPCLEEPWTGSPLLCHPGCVSVEVCSSVGKPNGSFQLSKPVPDMVTSWHPGNDYVWRPASGFTPWEQGVKVGFRLHTYLWGSSWRPHSSSFHSPAVGCTFSQEPATPESADTSLPFLAQFIHKRQRPLSG